MSRVAWILFYGAVRTLELVSGGQLAERVPGDAMAAHQAHRRVAVRRLLPEDGAGEDGVVAGVRAQVDLDRKFVLRAPDSGHLSLVHHL